MSAMAVEAEPTSNSGSGSAAVLPADNDGDYYQVSIRSRGGDQPVAVLLLLALVWFSMRRPLAEARE